MTTPGITGVRAALPAEVSAAPVAEPAAVAVQDAGMTYPDGTRALQPVRLRIAPGEFVTLLGPSGCGKSTLLKMIAGLLAPTQGRIALWDQPVGDLEASGRRLAFVFQSPTLMPWASVRTNVRLPLDLARVPADEAARRVDAALALVGLAEFAAALPRTLSGGMQMRVSIARSLVTQPQLLLMDEPFGALDEITRYKLDAELLELWRKRGLTVVFVTHSIQEAVFLSNRVIMMAARPGRVTEELVIDEAYPRQPEFAVSARFSQYARRLQESLLRASGGLDAAAPHLWAGQAAAQGPGGHP
jgi:NitT/TauT family transport system ATP-binding protein